MALVDYSDSDDSVETTDILTQVSPRSTTNKLKHKREVAEDSLLPPLPDAFLDLYATNVRASTHDDPTLHSGRRRVTPHVEGNWPSHLYIECEAWILSSFLPEAVEADKVEGIPAPLKLPH